MSKNILFTGAGGSGNELIWQLLKKKYNIFFCDMSVDNVNPIIPKNRPLVFVNQFPLIT